MSIAQRKPIPPLKSGKLGGKGFFSKPVTQQKKTVLAEAKKVGEKKVIGRLRAIQVLNKNKNPTLSKKAKKLSNTVAGSMKGKKQVKYPKGFSKRK